MEDMRMGEKWKGLTTIGIMPGAEFGADFFKPWRAAKARNVLVEEGVDFFLVPGSTLNLEGLGQKFIAQVEKRLKKKVTASKISHRERKSFCDKIIKQLLDEIFPPVHDKNGKIIKYWVFPCTLFELKPDKLQIAKYIYENLSSASQDKLGKSGADPYVRVCNEGELIEIEDNVVIKTLGIIMPSASFFRGKILSTPIEREITYQQLASIGRPIPDMYIAGSFAATINEPNPRGIPQPRPYVAVPSLSIKHTNTILQNTLGYSILRLFPQEKNRAEYELTIMPLTDALSLECEHAKRQVQTLEDGNQQKVAGAIIDKIRVGTKVTIGKIEMATGLSRDNILEAIKGLGRAHFEINLEMGEIKNPYRIVPNTQKDLTQYRTGEFTDVHNAAGACLHIPDISVDYDFVEHDLPVILLKENIATCYLVGDLTEGNKYDQDRQGLLLDRFAFPQDQKELAGYLMATRVAFPIFKQRFEQTKDITASVPRIVTIPGNHDVLKNEPPLERYHDIFQRALVDFIYEHLKRMHDATGVDYLNIKQAVGEKIILLDNPDVDGNVGLIHEYSQSAEQSTGKVQKAVKQFMALSHITTLLLANHHEKNFMVYRIGNKTTMLFHLGTFKRFYGFESQRSKISEFGIALWHERHCGTELVRVDMKFIPSRIDFEMTNAKEYMEKNKARGIAYYEELRAYIDKGEVRLP